MPSRQPAPTFICSTAAALRRAADDLATTLFPATCRTCQSPLLRLSQIPLCDTCRNQVHPQTETLCHRCGEALDLDPETYSASPDTAALCHPCRTVPPPFERAVAHAAYRGRLREMVHLIKYERVATIASLLGPALAQAILTIEPHAARELLVLPVPLFPAKQRQRGYNQSELLASAAIAHLRVVRPSWRMRLAPALLTRTRDTHSQFELTPRGRRRNLAGAFAVHAAQLPLGCEVLLIDDIYTTGATARECAAVLRRAGARKVWIATLARAQTARIALWDDHPLPAPQGFG